MHNNKATATRENEKHVKNKRKNELKFFDLTTISKVNKFPSDPDKYLVF